MPWKDSELVTSAPVVGTRTNTFLKQSSNHDQLHPLRNLVGEITRAWQFTERKPKFANFCKEEEALFLSSQNPCKED